MNILFYIEPLIEQDKPYWKEGWANYVSWNIIKTLRETKNNYEFCLITNEAIAQTIDSEKNIVVYVLSQQELLKPFDTNYLIATTAWHTNSYTQEQLIYYKELMSRKLEAYIPDVIITFSPVPFLASLYPNVLVLHHEFSIFSRLPYPMSWFLDPVGMHSSSYFDKFKAEIEKFHLYSGQIQLLGNFKQLCQQTLKKKSPFEAIFTQKREQFDYLVLLPLQFSRYYLFDDLVPFKSQYEYCVYVLDNVPTNIGVVVNMHPEYPVLSEDAIKFLQWKYPHFISLQEFNTIYASGQFILPFVDGVITVSSSLALQALLFDKKVITLGKKCFHYLADSINLDNIEKTLSLPVKNKDAILYYILTRYAITPKYLHDPIWLSKFLNKSLDKFRDNGIDFGFYDAMDTDENIFEHLSSVVNEQSKVVPQYVFGHFTQLFIDQGDGTSEESSIKLLVAPNSEFQEFTFDLTDKQNIKTLRLDPLNECCVIELESLHVKNNNKEIDLLPYVHSNAEIHHGKSYFFTTDDSQIYLSGLDESTFENAQSLVVVLRYAHIAKDALHVSVKQTKTELDQTKTELFSVYQSSSWNLTRPLRKIKQILQGE
ncbi:hypothetical protein [Sulfurospirillum cavolei]|uniref:hypothetical protein n=1 Tax=Sulfurospirillum cavolei TaxID=366522 RepID=UPI0005A9CE47|nr:hypothetical protein [Sulfurospirillum cavolei]